MEALAIKCNRIFGSLPNQATPWPIPTIIFMEAMVTGRIIGTPQKPITRIDRYFAGVILLCIFGSRRFDDVQHINMSAWKDLEEGMPVASCLQRWMAVRSPVLQFSLLVKCSPSVRCSLGRSQVVVQCIHDLTRLRDARLTAVDLRDQKGIRKS